MQSLNLYYLKNKRQTLGITQQEMADELGFKNSSTYLKYETGAYSFKAEQLPILAKSLNCKIKDFFIEDIAKIAIREPDEII